jgi:hypothetical protein
MGKRGLKYPLSECKKVFHQSFHLEDDKMIDVAVGVFIANQFGADPLWLLFIAPPYENRDLDVLPELSASRLHLDADRENARFRIQIEQG